MTAPKIALIAGENSGDQLGGALIRALQVTYPDAHFCGIGGAHMREAGFDAWWDIEELSVMGLFEVLKHLPRLLSLRKELTRRIVAARPDVLIGIDAPDFNLGLEKRVRAAGITTVQYVSPTVWAWREGRAGKIGRSADLVLCLFPFEPDFYRSHGVEARYTGHPLADSIPLESEQGNARNALGLPTDATVVALMPGSRGSEVERLAAPMLDAAEILAARHPGIKFIAPLANVKTRDLFEQALSQRGGVDCLIHDGGAIDAMAAADVVVLASGTASLECMLVNRPMVVTYVLAGSTYAAAKSLKLVKARYISLPNLLSDEALVPELIQHEVTGAAIAAEVEGWLTDHERAGRVRDRFDELHRQLRRDAAASAAAEIQALLERRDHGG